MRLAEPVVPPRRLPSGPPPAPWAVALAVALVAGALVPAPALGAGFFLTDRGARAMARGGAFTAGADDLNAAWFNPSLVGRGANADGGVLLYADVGLIHQSQSFKRTLDPETQAIYPDCCVTVENDQDSGISPLVSPSLMGGYAGPGGRWAAALSVYGPYADLPDFPEDGPQRYSVVKLRTELIHIQATGAYAVTDTLRVGVGLQMRSFTLKQRLVISTFPGFIGAAEDRDWDALVELDVADHWNPGAVVGVWFSPVEHLELGASYQTPLTAQASGQLRVQVAGHYMFSTTFTEGGDILLQTKLPQVARFGARWVGGEDWDVEAGVVWEDWSAHDDVLVEPQELIRFRSVPGIDDYVVRDFRVHEGFEDTFSFRLGGSYRLADGLRLSLGGFYEQGAVPDETITVNLVDSDKVGVGVGVGVDLADGVRLDVGYSHAFLASRDVTTSERRQTNTLYPEGTPIRTEARTIVGNGHYEAAFDALGIGLSAEL